jgi:hypothetical protein
VSTNTDIDDAIRSALSAEDASAFARFDQHPSLPAEALATLQGRHRGINSLGWIAGFALFAVGCYFWWRMAGTGDLREAMSWGMGAGMAFLGLSLIKVWFWMELQSNRILREVKRVELQVAVLASRPRT